MFTPGSTVWTAEALATVVERIDSNAGEGSWIDRLVTQLGQLRASVLRKSVRQPTRGLSALLTSGRVVAFRPWRLCLDHIRGPRPPDVALPPDRAHRRQSRCLGSRATNTHRASSLAWVGFAARLVLVPSLERAAWWSVRRAQNRKPATYRCPLCGSYLPALVEHVLIAPEGKSAGRRHAHTHCVLQARRAGRLPTREDWQRTQPRRPSRWRRLLRFGGGGT